MAPSGSVLTVEFHSIHHQIEFRCISPGRPTPAAGDLRLHPGQTAAIAALYCGTIEIDALVYALYGLTEEEIEIVEGS